MKNIKNIRLKHYDYSSDGYYFVTICANDYKYADKSATTIKPINLLKLEPVIRANIEALHKMSGVKVDYWVIMPDHLHMIIILNHCPMALGEIVRRFKARVKKDAGFKVWQPNYYEHIVRNEKALQRIREYIQNNPLVAKIEFKQFYL